MNAWWNSLQKLSEFNSALRAVGFFTALIASFSAFGIWRVGARISFLQGLENLKTQEKISTANLNAQQAILGQRTLEEKTAEAKLEQEKLKQENLGLQIKLEQEKAARLKIEERLEHRHVTPAQLAILKKDLHALKGEKITVITASTQPEIATYANELAHALSTAGMDATFQSALLPTSHSGLMFIAAPSRLKAAEVVANVLVKANIVSGKIPLQPTQVGNDLEIIVGPKE
jgi:hypothetical protein